MRQEALVGPLGSRCFLYFFSVAFKIPVYRSKYEDEKNVPKRSYLLHVLIISPAPPRSSVALGIRFTESSVVLLAM